MARSPFLTPFNVNQIQGIPGPKGDPGAVGAAGPGQGVDCTTKGCVGDGVTDCTSGFLSASTTAATDPSGTVYVPAGVYALASDQTIAGNLRFAPGAVLKPASGQTITITGQVHAHDYQQIFDCSLGGKVVLPNVGKISVCWFGANPNAVLADTADRIRAAIASVFTGINTGDGPLNNTVYFPPGQYQLEKPISVTSNGVVLRGESYSSSCLQTSFTGPAVCISSGTAINQHLNDYDSTLASGEIGDGGQHFYQLNAYGPSWYLNGLGAFSMDIIVKTSTTQAGTSYILTSSGNGPINTSVDMAFAIETLAADLGYANNNLGIAFTLKTTNGTVTALTQSASFATDGSWHHFRFDYDGSYLRVFKDGVAQTLTNADTKIAQTGNIVQAPTEGVLLGQGQGLGFGSADTAFYPPTGLRMACLRMGHVSRGASNFTPPSGKYPEDGSTNCLIDFDVIENDGGLLFGRFYSSTYGMMNAWIPNIVGGAQIDHIEIRDLQLDAFNGPAIDSAATPRCTYRDLLCRAQSGVLLHNNGYFSYVGNIVLIGVGGSTAWGMGIKLGGASNFVTLQGVSANGFTVNVYSEAIFSASGSNYWTNPSYVNVYLEGCYQAELSGSCFTSDEGSSFHCTMGVVCKACGDVKFSGFIFGLQAYNDQYQVVINNSQRPVTQDNRSRIGFDHCTFSTDVSTLSAISIATTLVEDSVIVNDCSQGVTGGVVGANIQDYFDVSSDSLAKLLVFPIEHKTLAITISDANTNLTMQQWLHGKLAVSGTLTGDRNLVVPTLANYTREIENLTAHALLVKTASGTGAYIPPGQTGAVSCDGTNVLLDWLEGTTVRTISSGSSSTANAWDQVVALKVSGVYDLTTPPSPIKGQLLVVKDQQGDAGTNTKTITASAGQTIDGAATVTIAVNFGKVALYFDGVSDWMS